MTAVYPISMPETMRKVTLQVRVVGVRRTRARMWIGTQLLRVAAWIIGCGIEIGAGDSPATFDEDGVPSRLSVDDKIFPRYVTRLDIFLDGVEQDRVTSYDKEKGELTAWVGDVLATKRGRVEVRLKDPAL